MNGNIRLRNLKLVALDTNIFIYYLHDYLGLTTLAGQIFKGLLNGRLKAVTSIITLVELLSLAAPESKIHALKEQFEIIPNLEVLSVEKSIAIEAAQIRREYKFRLPDSLQLATARVARAKAFITNDARLKKFKETKVVLLTEIGS